MFFFFKQKTAYEMRISDWSSDVCSSDLLGAVADDAAVLLVDAGEEAGHVDEGDERDVECVAGAHEAGGLLGAVPVENPGKDLRLVADDADGVVVETDEAVGERAGPVREALAVVAVVERAGHHRSDERRAGKECVSTCRVL